MQNTEVSLSLKPCPDQVRIARQRVAQLCEGLEAERVEVAELLVSELMTSALQHGPSRLGVVAQRIPQQVRVDISEDDPQFSPAPDESSVVQAPALRLLAHLASEWGVDAAAGGRTLWFTIEDL